MGENVRIHPRVVERHPELTETDVMDAWESCMRSVPRMDPDRVGEYIAIGTDGRGRLIEMIARLLPDGSFLIFHAFTPPTRKALCELGLARRR